MSLRLIGWADLLFVMEDHHKERLPALYGGSVEKEAIVLDIPDEYPYMDEELIRELRDSVSYYLSQEPEPEA